MHNSNTCSFISIFVNLNHLLQDSNEAYVGTEALSKSGMLKVNYPIEHGVVTFWDDMEKIWNHSFYEQLRVKPENQSILLTETPLNPKLKREKMAKMLFEVFNVRGVYFVNQAALALKNSGKTSGCFYCVVNLFIIKTGFERIRTH